ncbi:hypothetical protein [Aliiroseovarius sp.]|uniref:hypothetical protein n=1 Tax=Aliiroseovarius sp. TaxID=1872442 RepID=UPI003BACD244
MRRVITLILSEANRFLMSVSGEGGRSLKPYEAQMVWAVLEVLPAETSQLVQAQLAGRFFVDRSNPRIHSLHFDRRDARLAVADEGFDDALFKLSMRVDGKRQTGRVTYYKGYLFSVETPKPEKTYRDAEIEILSVTRASPKASLAHIVDRLEHGRGEGQG